MGQYRQNLHYKQRLFAFYRTQLVPAYLVVVYQRPGPTEHIFGCRRFVPSLTAQCTPKARRIWFSRSSDLDDLTDWGLRHLSAFAAGAHVLCLNIRQSLTAFQS